MDTSNFVSQALLPHLALQILGAITTLAVLFNILDFVYLYFLRPSQLKEYLIDPKTPKASKSQISSKSSETKSWVLVTGASDGIGKALSHQLAQAGFNVILHGRNPEKLNGVLKGLQEANPRTYFRVLVADASDSDGMQSAITRMADDIKVLPGPLTILINNVGGTAPTPRVFTPLRELEHGQVEGLIALNARFAVQLTRALLPGMLARKADLGAKAAILLVGSAAHIGVPMQSVYGGAKGLLRTFACSLARELNMEGYAGISAMYILVGHVTYAGPFTGPPTLFTPTAVTLARNLLHKVGCGRNEVTPFWAHAMQFFFAKSLPEWLLSRLVMNEIRKDMMDEEKKAKKA